MEQKLLRVFNHCRGLEVFTLCNRFTVLLSPVKKILLVSRDNPGRHTGAEEVGLAEIRGDSFRTVEENLKDSRASGTTKLQGLLPHTLSHP
jgi:hypothetical protein